jgi:hypothetical protein
MEVKALALNVLARTQGVPSGVPRAALAGTPVAPICVRSATAQGSWPPESLHAQRRFAQPHAKLFPFIGRKVRTPAGPGTLLQVFADRVTVVLDSELPRCSFFLPDQIEPVSWDLADSGANTSR